MKGRLTAVALLVATLGAAACDQGPSSTQPSASRRGGGEASLSKAATAAVEADRPLVRAITLAAARDGIENADRWFGDRAHRTPDSICRGVAAILAKHMATYDQAKRRTRTHAARMAEASAIAGEVGCGKQAPMTLFGRPMALLSAPAIALPDSVDDWFAANWHEDFWIDRVNQWADRGIMFLEPYNDGMTEFEIANFQGVQCAAMDVVSDLEGSEGGGFAMYFWPAWTRAVLVGCGTNVVVNIPDLVVGARGGFALGGPWGAAAGATAVAAEHCIYGAIAGYLVYRAG